MNDLVKLRRALLSMSRKEGLPEFAAGLRRRGVELVSTGGTAAVLRGAGLPVIEVSELTGFEDAFDGRVKTLHPVVHGAILADTSRSSHAAALRDLGIEEIDLVAVGLYPFEDTVGSGAAVEDCVENIDIGGPAMIRAAAKNHARVVVLTDPEQYLELVSELEEHEGATTREYRQRLAAEAFARTAAYDAAIAEWVHAGCGGGWPARLTLSSELGGPLRYGENPHQRAAVYRAGGRPGAVLARLLQGKPCSYNNLRMQMQRSRQWRSSGAEPASPAQSSSTRIPAVWRSGIRPRRPSRRQGSRTPRARLAASWRSTPRWTVRWPRPWRHGSWRS